MPTCCPPHEKDEANNAVHDWREPPGYLGEAVRRAKLIPSRANKTEPLPAKPRD